MARNDPRDTPLALPTRPRCFHRFLLRPSSHAKLIATQWGALIIAVLFGSALIASAAMNYASTVAASRAIALGQGARLFEDVRADLTSRGQPLNQALASALHLAPITYLAIWESGRLLAAVGNTDFPGLAPTPLQFQMGAKHARMCLPGIPGLSPSSHPPPDIETWARLPADRVLVMEFVPTEAQELAERTMAGLWLSISAAVLLTSAAAVLWSLGRRAELMRSVLTRQEQLAKLGAMSAVLAHEIRNPLASLKGNAQLLAENPSDARSRPRIERVVQDAVRLETLTNDLLAFARSGAVQTAPASPAAVLEAAVMTVDADRVDVSVAGAPPRWSLDAGRLEQVLVNLLDNALHVTPPGQRVVAAVARSGSDLLYTVRDHGPGVELAQRVRIFEPFYTTDVRGTGLGLAIALRIVELHGGRIEVDDAPGGGAIFRVRIP